MKIVTLAELTEDLFNLLDEVFHTGTPLEINMGDSRLRIKSIERVDKFQRLVPRAEAIRGDPEDLVDLSWGFERF